jgi:hypothetical protein
MRIRTVANEGVLAAFAASKPGVRAKERDYNLEAAKVEIERLSPTATEIAVKPDCRTRGRYDPEHPILGVFAYVVVRRVSPALEASDQTEPSLRGMTSNSYNLTPTL